MDHLHKRHRKVMKQLRKALPYLEKANKISMDCPTDGGGPISLGLCRTQDALREAEQAIVHFLSRGEE